MRIHWGLESTPALSRPMSKAVFRVQFDLVGWLGLLLLVERLVHMPILKDALCCTGGAEWFEADIC